eukprot:m51a1_g7360 putative glycoside family 63 (839) ;mRNA; r:39133-42325
MSERQRLDEARDRARNWGRWGPYLSERQWSTVREDYSPAGDAWSFFPFEHSAKRAYRWGEDGLLGICDRECRLCLALALWNEHDPILKERLFGLTNAQGNHGEDVKELYYYLDATPTSSYLKALYKYPQAAYPYEQLVKTNAASTRYEPEYELLDTGVLDGGYFDVLAEYAKAGPDDVCARFTVSNRAGHAARIHVLPTLWFRNTWEWGCSHEGCSLELLPSLVGEGEDHVVASHSTLGQFHLRVTQQPAAPTLLFTENSSNYRELFGAENRAEFTKDAFHKRVVHGDKAAVVPVPAGTKAAAWYALSVPANGSVCLRLSLSAEDSGPVDSAAVDEVFRQRIIEADEFYGAVIPQCLSLEERAVSRQAYAGLLWSKQFYHYSVRDWLEGDTEFIKPSPSRWTGRNCEWEHIFNRDVISMPDKWEYPWYACWDLAFHLVAMADIDPDCAKSQLILFLREWYMHPNGQLPAYEFNFSDVNPPVHAWACMEVYKKTGSTDKVFLARCFQKLLLNFTWWVNRKDPRGKNLFSGGFLGLDNIGVFDRSKPLPGGAHLEQADGTAWMGFYCSSMLEIALELAKDDMAYEDMASKFFEHFLSIVDAINGMGDSGLWDERDGFYYDQVLVGGNVNKIRCKSLVGLLPLIGVTVLDCNVLSKLPNFVKRMKWLISHCKERASHLGIRQSECGPKYLLSLVPCVRLRRVLESMLDEEQFLSDYGIRSLSLSQKPIHCSHFGGGSESDSAMFGGNSNWRGPIWFPTALLLVQSLTKYHKYYGDSFTMSYPSPSGQKRNLEEISTDLCTRLASIFLPGPDGSRPCHGRDVIYSKDPHFTDLILFYEYFHA